VVASLVREPSEEYPLEIISGKKEHRMGAKRIKDLIAAWMVGNGAMMFIAPRQRALLWVIGPQWVRKLALWYADHPVIMRLRGAAGVGLGLWVALRQYEGLENEPVEEPVPWYRRRFSG
jgi:hypothetical protein